MLVKGIPNHNTQNKVRTNLKLLGSTSLCAAEYLWWPTYGKCLLMILTSPNLSWSCAFHNQIMFNQLLLFKQMPLVPKGKVFRMITTLYLSVEIKMRHDSTKDLVLTSWCLPSSKSNFTFLTWYALLQACMMRPYDSGYLSEKVIWTRETVIRFYESISKDGGKI